MKPKSNKSSMSKDLNRSHSKVSLGRMRLEDIEEAAALIDGSMNSDEGRWARRTMEHHFACQRNGIDDGRSYFVWRRGGKICGLAGLHHYLWGPEHNVWLSWFAVASPLQGSGAGKALLASMESLALSRGYRKFFVETYTQREFDEARGFYEASGFTERGRISGYLDDGSDMVVYGKDLPRE